MWEAFFVFWGIKTAYLLKHVNYRQFLALIFL